ncbi:MAG: rhomboid family intramembrane serine protease [Candidatus Omnitrophica bacterium]|nr:rhomboid family intramembrane serine protease [Candidatus Omnitrophota bacterium]
MDNQSSNNTIDMEVILGRGGSGYIKGKPFPLDGPGTVRIDGETVTFTSKTDRAPTATAQETLTFHRAQFANVGIRARQIMFCLYPPGGERAGAPLYIGSIRCRTRAEAEQLFKALPRHLSPEVTKMALDRSSFAQSLFKVTPRAFVTPAFLVLCIAYFVMMTVQGVHLTQPRIDDLIHWGGNFGPATLSGEWWRLVSNTFMHIGLIHLFLNMWVLNGVGRVVERMFGNALFAVIYLAAGVCGSLASMVYHPEVVSAGASGAIFGLYGALLGFSLRQRRAIPVTVFKELRNSSLAFVGYNVVFGFTVAGIDNAAHIGGLLGGTLLGYLAAMPLDITVRKKALAGRLGVTLVAAVVVFGLLVYATPRQEYAGYARFVARFMSEMTAAQDAQMEIAAGLVDHRVLAAEGAARLEEECLAVWDSLYEEGRAVRLPRRSLYHQPLHGLTEYARLRAAALREFISAMRTDDSSLIGAGAVSRRLREANRLQEAAEGLLESALGALE